MQKPTIRDVARRASVSLKTVSRVINHEPAVRERTRAKVMKLKEEEDRVPFTKEDIPNLNRELVG